MTRRLDACFRAAHHRTAIRSFRAMRTCRILHHSFQQWNSGNRVEHAQFLLRNADAVCFDVDSTVVVSEGLDLLAECFGVGDAVEKLTKRAMDGNMKFEDALRARLELLNPTKDRMQQCVRAYGRPQYSPGIQEVVHRLRERGADIFLVSGGFRTMIEPIAADLCIPRQHVFANNIVFDGNGRYAGFDETEPTSRDGGKPAVLHKLKKEKGYKTMVMIGDGATDLQARPPADAFIGYGGVQVRSRIQQEADWFVHSFSEILAVVPPPLPSDLPSLKQFRCNDP